MKDPLNTRQLTPEEKVRYSDFYLAQREQDRGLSPYAYTLAVGWTFLVICAVILIGHIA